jgi:hypothetical protein
MVYKIAPQVAVESFEDGALVLKLEDRSLTELNPTARCARPYRWNALR